VFSCSAAEPDVSELKSDAKSVIIRNLVALADIYCAATGRSRSSVAKEIHGRGGHIDDLEAGRRDLTTTVAEIALNWFSTNWPDDAVWPDEIARPFPQDADRVSTAGADVQASGPALSVEAAE
jgi:hypothetical protein